MAKRLITLLLASILTMSLVACGGNSKETETAEEIDGLANPVVEMGSLEDVSKEVNAALITPTDVEIADEHFSVINGTPVIGEYTFTLEGYPCTLRVADVDIETDISGIYNDDGSVLFQNSESMDYYVENDNLKGHRWVTVDGQYTFVLEDKGECDWTLFENLCTQFDDVKPVNWTSEVPFETYKEMEGYYQTEDGNFAAVSIVLDHVGLYGVIGTDDGNYVFEAEAVLDGDKLVYESEKTTLAVYDSDKGETTESTYFEGGAGSVTVKDGKLIFDGVNCDLFVGCEFSASDL